MKPSRFARLKELLIRAKDLPEGERKAYLDEACKDDRDLRVKVEEVLAHGADPHQFLKTGAVGPAQLLDPDDAATGPRASAPLPQQIAGYRIVRKLGEGGMGVVYEAEDTKLGRHVALKFLHPSMIDVDEGSDRLGHEARAAAALDHPNICTIYAIDEWHGQAFISMAFVEGPTLEERIQSAPLPVEDTVDIAVQMAAALHHAHGKKVVHRDIKPPNVKITSDGLVKILDFGVAAMIGDRAPGSTDRGPSSGTPGYMSPEQIDGSMIDGRTDIWALGCLLFECLSGERAFPGDNFIDVMHATRKREPRWDKLPGECPEPLYKLVRRCLAKEARNRYQSARDVATDLEDLQRDIRWGSYGAGAEATSGFQQAESAGSLTETAINAYRGSRITQWTRPGLRLDREFVRLTLLVDQGEGTASGRWVARPQRYRDLDDVLAALDHPAFVVLGPPGCGKTTLLRRLELDVAQRGLRGEDDRLTFFIQLNQYKRAAPGEPAPDPESWLAAQWSARHPGLPPLEEAMQQGRVLLLLDALNEMPAASAAELRQAVLDWKMFLERMVAEHPANRVVFSCRTLDYSAPLSSPSLRVPQVVIEPLTDEQAEQLLIKQSPEKGAQIWSELRGSPQLELMRSPYFLLLLVDQVEATGELPRGRAGLFTAFVRRCLRREIERDNPLFSPGSLLTERDVRRVTQWKWKNDWELPERGLLVRKLVDLAFGMQDRSPDGGASQIRADLDEALALIADERDEDIVRAGVALSVLDEDTATDEISFSHQLTQEYFAARRLAVNPEPERVRSVWKVEEMAPPLAELIESIGPGETLPALATTGWEETALLAGAMAKDPVALVRGLMLTQLELAGRCAAQPEVRERLSPDLLDELRAALVARSRDPQADLRVRINVGLALGTLGDPRFERHTGPDGDCLLPPLVEIAGGRYPIGEDEGFEYMGQMNRTHTPRHEVEIEPFSIGRFPVTNAEWALFMQAGGYEDERWWEAPQARRWWTGEGTADGMRATTKYWWSYFRKAPEQVEQRWKSGQWTEGNYSFWKSKLKMTEAEMDAYLRERFPEGKLRTPEFWQDERFNNPSQPVVGVCLFEAMAYASWLSARTDLRFRLPTEAEWEAAARGPEGRRYPWGDGFDRLRCNAADSRIRRTTPVGVFPNGDTPEGISDLAGNVTEWTVSLYGPNLEPVEFGYPYRADDGREDLFASPDILRVGRGGAWFDVQHFVLAAAREASHPASRFFAGGFRLVLSRSEPSPITTA